MGNAYPVTPCDEREPTQAGHNVEPNSALGEAPGYKRTHWRELTLFLREPRAPLDNNLGERALKEG